MTIQMTIQIQQYHTHLGIFQSRCGAAQRSDRPASLQFSQGYNSLCRGAGIRGL